MKRHIGKFLRPSASNMQKPELNKLKKQQSTPSGLSRKQESINRGLQLLYANSCTGTIFTKNLGLSHN